MAVSSAGLLLRFTGTTDSGSGSVRVINQSESRRRAGGGGDSDLRPAQRQRRNGLVMWFAVERSGLNAFAGAAEGTEITALTISPDTEITHVCGFPPARKGSLFAAVLGTLCDGALYARQAVDRAPRACYAGRRCRACPARRCRMCELPWAKLFAPGTKPRRPADGPGRYRHQRQNHHHLSPAPILRSGIKTGLIGTVQNLVESKAPRPGAPRRMVGVQACCANGGRGCTHAVMEVSSMP